MEVGYEPDDRRCATALAGIAAQATRRASDARSRRCACGKHELVLLGPCCPSWPPISMPAACCQASCPRRVRQSLQEQVPIPEGSLWVRGVRAHRVRGEAEVPGSKPRSARRGSHLPQKQGFEWQPPQSIANAA